MDMSFCESDSDGESTVSANINVCPNNSRGQKRKVCDISMFSPYHLRKISLLQKPKSYLQANCVQMIEPTEPKTYDEAVSGFFRGALKASYSRRVGCLQSKCILENSQVYRRHETFRCCLGFQDQERFKQQNCNLQG